ncbi:hypothetical protein ACFQU2_30160 [Siccirubricoccus deserti]|uniref:Uncharacterized protein n=1 Tax=Siccirubricoccus deserti TaxID=2013562 RepID=A0A9X0QZY6_9PROT|nr:hypothetical protein [Siccirubricoccus deserti]MBC4016785.1 hypothetical protein [Siccirubricoccus deserti]
MSFRPQRFGLLLSLHALRELHCRAFRLRANEAEIRQGGTVPMSLRRTKH